MLYAKEDSNKVNVLYFLALYHTYNDPDNTIYYAREINKLSEKINYPFGKFRVSLSMLHAAVTRANYPGVLETSQDMLKIAESLPYKRLYRIAMADYYILLANVLMRDTANEWIQFKENLRLIQESGDMDGDTWTSFSRYSEKFLSTKPDSAVFYAQKA